MAAVELAHPETSAENRAVGKKPTNRAGKKPATPAPAHPEPSDRGKARGLGVEVSLDHIDAVEAARKKTRLSKRAIVEMALEAWLTSQGLWPPA